MTITRRAQAGAGSNGASSTSEFNAISASGFTVSSTQKKTGSYSFRVGTGNVGDYGQWAVPATRQLRTCFHWYGQYAAATDGPSILTLRSAGAALVILKADDAGGLSLTVGGTVRDTEAAIITVNAWQCIGVDVKIHASAGWVKVYRDGIEILSYTGNTGDADITIARYGTGESANYHTFTTYTYFDDLYLDDTTGEATAAIPPDLRFNNAAANGNGNYSQCAGNDGNSTDNYLLVDDAAHDSDTTYVEADTLDERDTYAMETVTIPAGWGCTAVIPYAFALKTDAGTATQLALTTRLGTTDQDGDAQDLPTTYGKLWQRFTAKPGGGEWDQAALDDMECGFVGKGAF